MMQNNPRVLNRGIVPATSMMLILLVSGGCRFRSDPDSTDTSSLPQRPQPKWIRFRPPVGEASVTFPGTPREMPPPAVSHPTRFFSYSRGKVGALQFGVTTGPTKVPPEERRAFLESLRDSSIRKFDIEV